MYVCTLECTYMHAYNHNQCTHTWLYKDIFVGIKVCILALSLILFTSQVFDKCFLGGSPNAIPQSVFQGQMSAVYLWKEPIQTGTIAALCKLGPGYKVHISSFNSLSSPTYYRLPILLSFVVLTLSAETMCAGC